MVGERPNYSTIAADCLRRRVLAICLRKLADERFTTLAPGFVRCSATAIRLDCRFGSCLPAVGDVILNHAPAGAHICMRWGELYFAAGRWSTGRSLFGFVLVRFAVYRLLLPSRRDVGDCAQADPFQRHTT